MKSHVVWIVPALALAAAAGCSGSDTGPAAGTNNAGAPAFPRPAVIDVAAIKAQAEASTREWRARMEQEAREAYAKARAETAAVLGIAADEISRRAKRSTALVEVETQPDPTGAKQSKRTGTAFCVDASGLFITHADVVKGVTDTQGQVRMIFGDPGEPRAVVYPKVARIDDETNLASLRVDPTPELGLLALALARSAEISKGTDVVCLGFPRGERRLTQDAQGNFIEGPKFDFGYLHQLWVKEPPEHVITHMKVDHVWRENGRPSGLRFAFGPSMYLDVSPGSAVLNLAGEVIGIMAMSPDSAHEGALSVEHLSRFLATPGPRNELANFRPEGGRFAVNTRGRKATALVELSTRAGECSGTAFCIDRSGLFITNAHVIEAAIRDSHHDLKLVLDTGLPTQRILSADVVRMDPKVDLALLKTDPDPKLEALELGTDDDVAPTMQVTFFGFPFGKLIPSAHSAYPEVAINVSRVTALSPDVRFDGQLNPGNSGGPVVDSGGKVIAVARATILGAAINFAIPVGKLREFLAHPGLQIHMLPVAYRDRAKPTTWTIRVVGSELARLPQKVAVSATFPDGANAPRVYWAEPVPGGEAHAFRLEFVPRPRDPGPPVAISVRFANRTDEGIVEDREVTIGDRTFPLSTIRYLTVRPKPWAYVARDPDLKGLAPDLGEVVKGAITGLGSAMAIQDAGRKAMDLGAVTELTVMDVAPRRAPFVVAKIEVHKDSREGTVLCSTQTQLVFPDAAEALQASLLKKMASAPRQVPGVEQPLRVFTRATPKKIARPPWRLDDKENLFQLGGKLDVSGVPRGTAKSIRSPRGTIGKASTVSAEEDGPGTRTLEIAPPPAPPERTWPGQRLSDTKIFAISFSPDGSRLALGLHEAIRLYDVSSGRMIKELQQPNASQLAFSADGDKLLAFSDPYLDHAIGAGGRPFQPEPSIGPVIWNLKIGLTSPVPPIPRMEAGTPVEWISPDSPFVLTRGTGIKCWDVRSGDMRLSLAVDPKRQLAIKTGAGGNLPNPVVTADGKRLLTMYGPSRDAAAKGARAAAAAPGGAGPAPVDPYAASFLRLHDIESGELLSEMDFTGTTFIGLIAGSNSCVCEAKDGTVLVRDLKSGKEVRKVTLRPKSPLRNEASLAAAQVRPESSQVTPDGKLFVKPIPGGGFALFDLGSGAEVARFKPLEINSSGQMQKLVLPPSGRTAAVHFQRNVHLWTLPTPARASAEAAARKREVPLVRYLDGSATGVAVGGAGRYLLLTLRVTRRLAVFDVNAADIIKTIPLESEKVLVAAGASKFVIAYPKTKHLERWDLATLTRDGDPQPVPFQGTIEAIALGADSEGPLLVSWFKDPEPADMGVQGRFAFVDLASFKVLAVDALAVHGRRFDTARLAASGGDFELFGGRWVSKARIRASYDGSLFAISRGEDTASFYGEAALKADAGAVTVSHDNQVRSQAGTPHYMIPNPDGKRIFHGKTGVRDAVFLETPEHLSNQLPDASDLPIRFPTTDPRFDVSYRSADTIAILRAKDGSRVLTVTGLDEMTGVIKPPEPNIVKDGVSLENRYHVVPAAKLLVTIPAANDRLVLRRLDLEPVADGPKTKTGGPATGRRGASPPRRSTPRSG